MTEPVLNPVLGPEVPGALRDPVTGLGTRALLTRLGTQHLALAAARGSTAAVLLLDLDDFKRVNDTLGHEAGDRLLAEVGRRLRGAVGPSDLAVRLGGDEFAVLTSEPACAGEAGALADRLLAVLAVPVRLDDVQLSVRGSMGVAVAGEDGESLGDLLRAADEAMYDAKAEGSGHWRRHPAARAGDDSARLARDLRRGIPVEQMVLHYQPQVDARTGAVVGFEALLRWQHPDLGLLAPDVFLPLAERSGLMSRLTLVVLDRALTDLATLRRHAPGADMAVNISARNLLGQDLVADVASCLRRHELSPSSLVLEIVEPASEPSPVAGEALARLAEVGCQVSVHQFGTGQSSLTALSRHRAIREVKIAPQLVGQVLVDPSAERLVRALVSTAHGLDARVVAEGVESDAVERRVRELGVDRVQGFHLHPPAEVAALVPWLAARDVAPQGSPTIALQRGPSDADTPVDEPRRRGAKHA